jgi:hypothetical protein
MRHADPGYESEATKRWTIRGFFIGLLLICVEGGWEVIFKPHGLLTK